MNVIFRHTRWLIVALLIGLLPTVAVSAGNNDDGLRSIFAHGAGNRALAMGGAYAAVNQGPGAMIWNPAGLAWQQRYQAASTQTSLIGMGFMERYLAVVAPSWRYGNAGLALRTFGVDGIQERDDRNILLNDNLQDSETELLVGYARDLMPALAVGAGFKYRNHSLAGYSGSGVGVDLGVLFKPLLLVEDMGDVWDLNVGASLRNLVEPSIQLDEDIVPDPRSLRLGVACSRRFGYDIDAMLTADMEKTAEMDMDYHLGGEVGLRDILFLRGGMNRSELTFGFGITYMGMTVDYAFEDNPLDPVQRLGLGISFGSSASARETAYLAEQEKQRRKQMTAALQQRDDQQVADMMSAAATARAAEDYVQALEIMAMAQMMQPDSEIVKANIVELEHLRGLQLEDQGDLVSATVVWRQILAEDPDDTVAREALTRLDERQNEISLRTTELRDLYNDSMDAFAMGDLVLARDGFRSLMAADSTDVQSADMLDRLEEAFHTRARASLDQAQIMAVAGRYDEAEAALYSAVDDWPAVPGAREVRQDIETRRDQELYAEEQRRQEQARAREMASLLGERPAAGARVDEPNAGALTAEQTRELDGLYRQAMQRVDQNKTAEAIRFWELIWSRSNSYRDVSDLLCQEYLTRGMEAFAAGDLPLAVAEWEKALRVNPQDTRAQGYLQRAYKQQDRIKAIRNDS
jgi:tetratricopeptide (TPR) repeat protein